MKKWLLRIVTVLALIVLLIAAALGYAYFIEPRRLVVNEATLTIPDFSSGLNGLKIVAISDIHGGSNHVDESRLRELVELANEQSPDLVVLLGDYVAESKGSKRNKQLPDDADKTELRMPVETIADNLSGFRAKYGVYAVIGNHDWWHNQSKVRREFERVGIRILENQIEKISIGSETISLWGIEDYWKSRHVPAEPFNKVSEKKNVIALTHNPDSLLKTPQGISLMIAGHSHGGQVSFPFFGPIATVNDRRFMAGETVVDGKHVFVTSGVGCSGPQIRFGIPPEIAVLTLTSIDK